MTPRQAEQTSLDTARYQRHFRTHASPADTQRGGLVDAQPMETLYLSAITLAELRAGVALLPSGKRKAQLQTNLEDKVIPLFVGRILAFG